MELNEISEADFGDVTELWVASWKTLGWDIDFDARRSWLPGYLRDLAAEGAKLIGAFEGRLLGFVTINPNTGTLDQLCVAPTAYGKGVARALLDEAKRLAPQKLNLEVNAANARAIKFYRRESFVVTGEGLSPRSGLKTLTMRWEASAS